MRSNRPKPLHRLCGRPMLHYVLDALDDVAVERIAVVAGEGADQVAKALGGASGDRWVTVVEDHLRAGSAATTTAGLAVFADDFTEDDVVILPGDAPLLASATVAALVAEHRATGASATVLSTAAAGDVGRARSLVGGKDDTVARLARPGSVESRSAELWSAGVYVVRRSLLAPALRRVLPDPDTGTAPLADVVEVLSSAGHPVRTLTLDVVGEVQSIHDRVQLAEVEAAIRQRTNRRWMLAGVTMVDPERTYIDTTVRLAPDVTLFPGTLLQGDTVIGPGSEIGPDTRLVDCAVGARARVTKAMGRDAEVGEAAQVGPFAVLEPGSQVAPAAVTGPFYHAQEAGSPPASPGT